MFQLDRIVKAFLWLLFLFCPFLSSSSSSSLSYASAETAVEAATGTTTSTYYLIPTREGLAVNLISLNVAYLKVVKRSGRVLVLAPFTSEHYKDSGWIHICDYFIFPKNVVCTSEVPVDIVSRMPCVVDCSNKDWPCHQVLLHHLYNRSPLDI